MMKVRLAVQVFSQSVADALCTLSTMTAYPQFKDSTGTAEFLRVMLNSLNPLNYLPVCKVVTYHLELYRLECHFLMSADYIA